MSELVEHSITIHHFPLPDKLELFRVEELAVGYQNTWSLDVGALCYLRRSKAKRKPGRGRKVDPSSYCEERALKIRSFVRAASDFFSSSGRRVSTIFDLHSSFGRFLDWCDDNDHNSVLTNFNNTRSAFRDYVAYLLQLVHRDDLHVNTAADYQKNVLDVVETHFGFEGLGQGIHLISKSNRLAQSTLVPSNDSQAQVLAWCTCLFSGLSTLVLEKKSFPFAFSIPSYLHWPDDRLWVFPLRRWCETPGNKKSSQKYMAYDYKNGRVRTEDQLEVEFGKTKLPAEKLVKRAQDRIAAANNNHQDYSRRDRAVLGIQAFFLMFIAATGMNLAQATGLTWSEELEHAVCDPLVERQGFRTIKYRANNRLVSFELGVQYMPHLRRYLDLRAYLLNGRTSNVLFLGRTIRPARSSDDLTGRGKEQIQTFFKTLCRICPSLPKVLPMQWRAAKQDYVIRHYDPATAAMAMQHSESTALRNYSNGSEAVQQTELLAYLSQVENVVIGRKRLEGEYEPRAIGNCSGPGEPIPIAAMTSIAPDCSTPEGCLFCDKYRIHADKTDIRKLLSARACIKRVGSTANSHEQFMRLFGNVLQRIEAILTDLRCHNSHVLEEVSREVDIDGELDGYWAAKMDLLIELEIL